MGHRAVLLIDQELGRERDLSQTVITSSQRELERRLRGRASDSDEVVRKRFAVAHVEIEHNGFFDYLVVNDDVESAFQHLQGIVLAERSRRFRRAELAERLLRQGKL